MCQPISCSYVFTFVLLTALSSTLLADAFFPQPLGLSRKCISDLAQKRYQSREGDPFPMLGKVAVITGAAGGIGRALTRVVHELGGTIIAMDRNTTGLNILRDTLGADRVVTLPTNHEDLSSVSRSAEEILTRFGSIDLLVNNAGLAYPPDSKVGDPRMKSVHGYDLAFTVNYLSHFLLVEKLKPLLSTTRRSRVIHLTSTYHWKVDGSELIPSNPMSQPMAYQSDPSLQGPKHVERSYGNTKLAQIWHSRSIRGVDSVCACPTWVGTGIGGEESRDFLETMAFPVDGAGISSALNAMLRTEEELGDALNDGRMIVANSRVLEYLPAKEVWTARWFTNLGWRDGLADLWGFVLLLGQRFTFEKFLVQQSSPESHNNREGRELFYQWSLREVQPWL
mmetsp:Transcript_46737/g.69129  ORF Transcript_46737/g.69129 Transcript_46737/m.69129 type:complete len:395 (+) Transcript_46737:46-1230(+)